MIKSLYQGILLFLLFLDTFRIQRIWHLLMFLDTLCIFLTKSLENNDFFKEFCHRRGVCNWIRATIPSRPGPGPCCLKFKDYIYRYIGVFFCISWKWACGKIWQIRCLDSNYLCPEDVIQVVQYSMLVGFQSWSQI